MRAHSLVAAGTEPTVFFAVTWLPRSAHHRWHPSALPVLLGTSRKGCRFVFMQHHVHGLPKRVAGWRRYLRDRKVEIVGVSATNAVSYLLHLRSWIPTGFDSAPLPLSPPLAKAFPIPSWPKRIFWTMVAASAGGGHVFGAWCGDVNATDRVADLDDVATHFLAAWDPELLE